MADPNVSDAVAVLKSAAHPMNMVEDMSVVVASRVAAITFVSIGAATPNAIAALTIVVVAKVEESQAKRSLGSVGGCWTQIELKCMLQLSPRVLDTAIICMLRPLRVQGC